MEGHGGSRPVGTMDVEDERTGDNTSDVSQEDIGEGQGREDGDSEYDECDDEYDDGEAMSGDDDYSQDDAANPSMDNNNDVDEDVCEVVDSDSDEDVHDPLESRGIGNDDDRAGDDRYDDDDDLGDGGNVGDVGDRPINGREDDDYDDEGDEGASQLDTFLSVECKYEGHRKLVFDANSASDREMHRELANNMEHFVDYLKDVFQIDPVTYVVLVFPDLGCDLTELSNYCDENLNRITRYHLMEGADRVSILIEVDESATQLLSLRHRLENYEGPRKSATKGARHVNVGDGLADTDDDGASLESESEEQEPETEAEAIARKEKRVYNELMESDDEKMAGDVKRYMAKVSRKSM